MRALLPLACALALLGPLAPALAGHHPPHAAPDAAEPATALAEMATDGYVLQLQRPAPRTFEVRVLHLQTLVRVLGTDVQLQYAFDPVPLAFGPAPRDCADSAACSNYGVWLHTARETLGRGGPELTLPTTGLYLPQRLSLVKGAGGSDALRIELAPGGFDPDFVGAAIAVVPIGTADGPDWVRGFYNSGKLALPLDALDAVPEILRID